MTNYGHRKGLGTGPLHVQREINRAFENFCLQARGTDPAGRPWGTATPGP